MAIENKRRKETSIERKVYLRDQLVTVEDLENFRKSLISEIKHLLSKQPSEKKWLKSGEVRKLLKISPGTLQTLRENGTLRFSKVGGIIYFNFEDIQAALDANLSQPTT